MYPVFWKAGGPDVEWVWGFGYWSSDPESLPGDGLLTYHNLEGKSEKVREMDLVELQESAIKALLHWIHNIAFQRCIRYFQAFERFHMRKTTLLIEYSIGLFSGYFHVILGRNRV